MVLNAVFHKSQYQLVDFGDGYKLETFGEIAVCRPSPVASRVPKLGPISAQLCYSLNTAGRRLPEKGKWHFQTEPPADWQIRHTDVVFRIRPTPFGHLGLFPEQAANWAWLRSLDFDFRGLKALNLFAYTGGTTLTLASLGCQVTHIDAAKNVVNWSRENATLSGLSNAPIRWIAEDALRFVTREVRRENHYDIVIADPPSFGKGPKRETWKMDRDFDLLLERLYGLTQGAPKLCLLSCHTPGCDHHWLKQAFLNRFGPSGFRIDGTPMRLVCQDGACLEAGHCLRVWRPNA